MKTQLTRFKQVPATVFLLLFSTNVQALDFLKIQPTIKEKNLTILNCINVPQLPQLFQTTLTRTRVLSEGGQYTDLESYVTSVTSTSISADTEKTTYSGVVSSGGGLISAATLELGRTNTTFNSINNSSNYMDVTEESYEATGYLYKDVHRYGSYLRKPVGTICDDQTWLSNYDHISEITKDTGIISAIFPVNALNRIISLDVEKIVEAGTFITYQHSIDDGNTIVTNWVDTETGVLVASESRDSTSRALIATKELIEFFVPILGEPPVYYPQLEIDNFSRFETPFLKSIYK